MLPKNVQDIIEEQRRKLIAKGHTKEKEEAYMRNRGMNEEFIKRTLAPPHSKLSLLGVQEGTTFHEFYSNIRSTPLGQGEELYTLDEIIDAKESGWHEQYIPGIYDRFLQLSSLEGEGSYFYEIETDIVYDTDWGQEKAMMAGTLERRWPSFFEFLEWYYPIEGEKK